MMLKLIILPLAARFLKKLKEKPLKNLFQKAVDEILIDPYIGEPKSGDLSGIYCCDIYYNKTNSDGRASLEHQEPARNVGVAPFTPSNYPSRFKMAEAKCRIIEEKRGSMTLRGTVSDSELLRRVLAFFSAI